MLESRPMTEQIAGGNIAAVPPTITVNERTIPVWQQLWDHGGIRKTFVMLVLAMIWQFYARWLDNPLMLPTFTDTLTALVSGLKSGVIIDRTLRSLYVLGMGYGIGLALAAVFTALAIMTRLGTDFLEALTAMFNPLPSIALLPLALIWFGLGSPSLVFVLIHAVLWAVALNTHAGFQSVSPTLKMVGRNCGLRGIRFIALILVPAAFPSILTGLKIGWAFAWRTLIAAEMVFGSSGGSGGLGWYIFENKNQLNTPEVFAGLFCVIIIGLVAENCAFRPIEAYTVRRWGMQN
jgi:NitT/TauT family transport system permease protein